MSLDEIVALIPQGDRVIVGIVALLLAVLGLVALLNLFISFCGSKANLLLGSHFDWSLKNLCGYIFYPFTLAMGVIPKDASLISKIVGERLILTEVVSYQDLAAARLLVFDLDRLPQKIIVVT